MDACAASEQLPAALSAEIWIAEGTYRPSETRDKAAYFKVRGNTGYYGGFAGSETDKDQRVPGSNTVTITGDLGGGVYSEHLFMNADLGNRNAAFDGMKFTKARALAGTDNRGSAIYVFLVNNITVSNSVFEDIRGGSQGGAVHIYSTGGSISIAGCDFEDTEGGVGGALFANIGNGLSTGSVSIANCSFKNSKASSLGGALCTVSSSVSITSCNFENIQTQDSSGALYARGDSVNITGCDFENTKSGGAVGAVVASGGSVSIMGCGFTNTESGSYGGAVLASGGSVSITDCDFDNIKSGDDGGAISSNGSGPTIITKCNFTNCTAHYGSILFGQGTAFTIRPGCSVDGTPISSAADLDTVLSSPSRRYLLNGSTITFAP
jgi:hypothetical protein